MVLLLYIGYARWKKCSYFTEYWLTRWNGGNLTYNANKIYLRNQLSRPIHVLKDVVLKQDLAQILKDEWLLARYMAYIARILDDGDLRAIYALDPVSIFICCEEMLVVQLLGWRSGLVGLRFGDRSFPSILAIR